MGQHLQSSESVSVDGLGTFRMVMVARGKGVETSDEVSAAQATLTVRFQPTTTKNHDRTTATRSMVTGAKCARYDKTCFRCGIVQEAVTPVEATSPVEAVMKEAEKRPIRLHKWRHSSEEYTKCKRQTS